MPSLQELLAQADWVQGLAAAMASDEATRSDLVQETWVVALGHEQPVREPRAWLRRVMQNLVRQRGRAARRRDAREERAARPEAVEGPDTVVERAELHRRLVDRVMALPEPGRTLVLERYFEGLAPRALARRHGVPLETVRTRLKRALAQLRETMTRDEGAGGGDWRALAVPLAALRARGDAIVRVGAGRLDTVGGGPDGAEPTPAQVWTDATGAFVAEGVPPGEQGIVVRAAGLAPWQGTCAVVASARARVAVTLVEGATVRGTVRDEKGAPIVDAVIRSGEDGALTAGRVVTGADGSYTLTGLAPGETSLHARHALLGEARHTLVVGAGETAHWDVRFERGLVITGRLVRDDGQPVSGARIAVVASRREGVRGWSGSATSGRDGRFELANWPGGLVDVEVYGHGIERLLQRGLDRTGRELLLQARAVGAPSARIVGRVCAPDGTPLPNAGVFASSVEARGGGPYTFAAPTTARFELTPLQPGAYRVTIEGEGYARWRSEPITLADGGEVDLGAVHLQVGGIVQVQLDGDRPANLALYLRDAEDQFLAGISPHATPVRSRVIAPGSYQLCVRGEGLTEQSFPIVVRAGETTMITVDVGRGR